MKKSFFQKTYNLIINLTIISLICFLAQFCLGLFYQAIELSGLSQYNNSFILINDSLDNIKQVILVFSISILAISSILVIGQLLYRLLKIPFGITSSQSIKPSECVNFLNKSNTLNLS